MSSTTLSRAHKRVLVTLSHLAPAAYFPSNNLSAQGCSAQETKAESKEAKESKPRQSKASAVTNFLPSFQTISALPSKMKSFVEESLNFSGVNIREGSLDFDVKSMRKTMDMYELEHRDKIQEWASKQPIFKKLHVGLSLEDQRKLTLEMVRVYTESGMVRFQDSYENPWRWAASLENLPWLNPNLSTACGVHFGLFGGTVMNLGTEKHHAMFADKMTNLEVRGSFSLTELGHGSNARALETTAVYDQERQEFVLHTPTETAQKYWIGFLAKHCTHTVVFAQLHINGQNEGMHAFVVQIRNPDGSLTENVRVADVGVKMGLNGIDNGRLWLNNKRVPRDALLNRYADVTPDGKYVSPIKSRSERFATTIGALVAGRVAVAQSANSACKLGLTIALRYACSRRQFGPNNKPENLLIDYLSHQRRLFPFLATTYALQFALNHSKVILVEELQARGVAGRPSESTKSNNEDSSKDVHIFAAGLKPLCTWHRSNCLQVCRESCGGFGFHAANQLAALKTDMDVDITWEGDNMVLLQQVTGSLLKQFRSQFAGNKFTGTLAYLGRHLSMELRDKNPVTRNNSSESHLLDLEVYRRAFEYREGRLLSALVNRLQNQSKLTKEPFQMWNQSLDLVIELGLAHTERRVLECFIEGIEKAPENTKHMLHILCSLWAITRINAYMGWFMSYSYFSPAKARAFNSEINKLCRALRPHIGKLIDAFGIHEDLIYAPIAKGDGPEGWVAANTYPKVMGSS